MVLTQPVFLIVIVLIIGVDRTYAECLIECASKPNNLTEIDCSYQKIQNKCLRQLFNIIDNVRTTSLNLAGNSLSVFPTFYQSFPNLLFLNLSHNTFAEIPSYLAKLTPKLEKLDLTGNQIRNISASSFLNESGTRVGIPSLLCLILTQNKIKDFFGEPFKSGFKNLARLHLDLNLIDLSFGWDFHGLVNLVYLDLHGNKIVDIGIETFQFSHYLSFLDLSENLISDIWSLTFNELYNLDFVSLSRNYISTLHTIAFSRCTIKTIDLTYNRFESITEHSFSSTTVDNIYLNGNPLLCECTLSALLSSLKNEKVTGNCSYLVGKQTQLVTPITSALSKMDCLNPCTTHFCSIPFTECILSSSGHPECVCKHGNLDDGNCRKPLCYLHLCQNSARCIEISQEIYKCICKNGFYGLYCENSMNTSEARFIRTTKTTTMKTKLTKFTEPQSNKQSSSTGKLSLGYVILIAVSAFLIGTIVSLLIYHKIVRRPKSNAYGNLKMSTFEVENNNV